LADGQRPMWEKVGAVLTSDVKPHELMKVRLLNVIHSALSYTGILAGMALTKISCPAYDNTHESMDDIDRCLTSRQIKAWYMSINIV